MAIQEKQSKKLTAMDVILDIAETILTLGLNKEVTFRFKDKDITLRRVK